MQPLPDSAAPETAGTRVLIVDDNVDAADTLADLLLLDGYEPVVCYAEQAAIDTARRTPPDVVILDIGMPERGGHVLARQLREMLPDVLMIAFTGFSRSDDIQRSVQSGIDEHWIKPMGAVAFSHALATARARHATARR
jgi:two-component system, sensor histidine kinase